MAEVDLRTLRSGRWLAGAIGIGAGGVALWLLALSREPRHALLAYLAAWGYAVFIAVGALVFIAAGHAMNARWIVAVRRLAHTVTASLPLLMLGLVPILVGAGQIYPWLDPDPAMGEHARHMLRHKEAYLSLPMFATRSIVYFLIWIGAAWKLRSWSLQRDEGTDDKRDLEDEAPGQRERTLSCVTLPFIGLAVTFAAFDWLMSLQPLWLSTIFGLYVFSGGFVAALALVTVLAWASVRSGALEQEIRGAHFYALGRLLLAFTVFWAYCGYFQAMLIRIANLPQEVTFFLRRMENGWEWIAYVLILGHFALPFAVLLIRRWKYLPGFMAAVSAWLLLMGLVDVYWLVLPVVEGHSPRPDWIELSALCGVFGSLVAFAGWRQRGRSLLEEGDPHLAEGLAYKSRY